MYYIYNWFCFLLLFDKNSQNRRRFYMKKNTVYTAIAAMVASAAISGCSTTKDVTPTIAPVQKPVAVQTVLGDYALLAGHMLYQDANNAYSIQLPENAEINTLLLVQSYKKCSIVPPSDDIANPENCQRETFFKNPPTFRFYLIYVKVGGFIRMRCIFIFH